jgi:glutamyl-tRNA reductase
MNPFKQAVKQAAQKEGGDLPAKTSSPKLPIGEATLNRLPVLTEVATQENAPQTRALSAEESQQFLQQLQTHIETLFTKKLSLRLEELQRHAIDHALDELKAELPELLRDALNAHFESH